MPAFLVVRPGGGVRLRRPHRPQHDVPARGHRRWTRAGSRVSSPGWSSRPSAATPSASARASGSTGGCCAGTAMSAIALDVRRRGGLFVIAHPASVGDPVCSGCDWRFPDMMPGPALRRGGVERALGLQQQQRAGPRPLVRVARRGASRRRDRGIGHARPRRGLGAGRPQRGVVAGLHRGGDPRRDRGRSPVRELRTVARAVGLRRRPGRHDGGHPRGGIRRARGALGWLPVRLVPAPGGGRRRAGRGAGRRRRNRRWEGMRARWFTPEVRDRAGGLLAVTNPVRIDPAGTAA